MLRDLGQCESPREVEREILFYKERRLVKDGAPGRWLLAFSGRRVMSAARIYFP